RRSFARRRSHIAAGLQDRLDVPIIGGVATTHLMSTPTPFMRVIRILGSAGAVVGAVDAWFRLDFLAVEARVAVSLVAILLLLFAVACEFAVATQQTTNRAPLKWSVGISLLIAIIGVVLTYFTVAWHTVLSSRACKSNDPGWQCDE